MKGLWPQVAIWAREGHAEDRCPLPLPDWGGRLQLEVHLHHGLPGHRACMHPKPEGKGWGGENKGRALGSKRFTIVSETCKL